jgi:hypothetical protein
MKFQPNINTLLAENGLSTTIVYPNLVPSDFSVLPEEVKAQIWTFSLCCRRYGISFPSDITCLIFSEVFFDFWQRVHKDGESSKEENQQKRQHDKMYIGCCGCAKRGFPRGGKRK